MRGRDINMKCYRNKGISLITLIITVIVIVIIASAIILSVAKNNSVTRADEAVFEQNVQVMQELLNDEIADISLSQMIPPDLYTDNNYNKLVGEESGKRVKINVDSSNKNIGFVYYKINDEKYCIVFGKSGLITEQEGITYRYTDNLLPTNGEDLNWYITDTNHLTFENSSLGNSDSSLQNLADVASIGDFVNYNQGEHTMAPNELGIAGATLLGNLNTTDVLKWRVMSIDSTLGKVELIADNIIDAGVLLQNFDGYVNGIDALNKVCALYGHGDGASSARSITVEDVNTLSNYTPADPYDDDSFTYTSGSFIVNNQIVNATEENPVTITFTSNENGKSTNKYYTYLSTSDYIKNKSFWLASQAVGTNSNQAGYIIRFVSNGTISEYAAIFSSITSSGSYATSLLPVVTLNVNIKTTGQDDNGVWQLDV